MSETLWWLVQNLSDVPEGEEWLSEAERRILAGKRFPKRRNDWRLGRWTAKRAVRAYLREKAPSMESLEIRAVVDGAPEAFRNDAPVDVSLSISHSNDRSLCVVGPSGIAIGCDLEQIETREPGLVLDYYTPDEMAFCDEAPETEKDAVVNLIWSAKESALKVLREGLRRDTRSIRVCPDWPGAGAGWSAWTGFCMESPLVFRGWWRICEGYVYTLASDHATSSPKQLLPGDSCHSRV